MQSTTLALLAATRDKRLLSVVGEPPEMYVFADTGDEPVAVYEHLEKCRVIIEEHGAQLEVVSRGQSITEHIVEKVSAGKRGISPPPLWVATADGSDSMPIRRGCTQDFKAKPIDKHLKATFKIKRGHKGPPVIEQWLGISIDEVSRMKDSKEKWRLFRYPLIEMGWKRTHCNEYLDSVGMVTPRSACSYCPFHDNNEWKALMSDPVERERIIAFERMVRSAWRDKGAFGVKSEPFLHRSRIPIDEVDFDGGQQTMFSLWNGECEGMCGL